MANSLTQVLRDVALVRLKGRREGVAAVGASGEVQVLRLRRLDHGDYRVDPRVRDRARRQSFPCVRIIWGIELQVLDAQLSLPVAELTHASGQGGDRVLDRGVGLERQVLT